MSFYPCLPADSTYIGPTTTRSNMPPTVINAAHHGGPRRRLVHQQDRFMFTAIVRCGRHLCLHMGGATQANAGLMKNDAAIKKTEASNQWNYFQSKSTKQSLAELARDLTRPRPKGQAPGQDRPLRKRKERDQDCGRGAGGRRPRVRPAKRSPNAPAPPLGPGHHRALQVAIALAAIALSRPRRSGWNSGMYGVAAVGPGVGALAFLHI